jgi:hypothetical protein
LQSRYYNPEWGRFINADAIGGKVGELLSHNIFAYCQNNIINNYDFNGYDMRAIEDGGGGCGGVVPTLGYDILEGIATGLTAIMKIGAVGYAGLQNYNTLSNSSTKSKTKAVPINADNSRKQKPNYWEADFKFQTKLIEIGNPISQQEAIERVSTGKSIMSANATKAR